MKIAPPKKLNDYIHYLKIIYGGTMDRTGLVECIAANIVAYKTGWIGKNNYLKTSRHFIDLLHHNILINHK
jgi:hypothetical protein